jgi:hypothetical protein
MGLPSQRNVTWTGDYTTWLEESAACAAVIYAAEYSSLFLCRAFWTPPVTIWG